MRIIPRLLAAAALFAAAPLMAQSAQPRTTATRDADPALWVVRDADTTIYLFGTVHVLRPGLSWFDEAVADAFNASDELVLELPAGSDARVGELVAGLSAAQDGKALTARLTPEQRGIYTRAMASVSMPVARFETREPWLPAMLLAIAPTMRLGYNAHDGTEATLTRTATAAGKRISGLETADIQLGFFDTMPVATQIDFLIASASAALNGEDSLAPMIEQWAAGDPDRLGELMNAELASSPELARILLTDRNANWAEWIRLRLAEPGGRFFVAVGAGHLAGAGSVQQALHAHGITATRVEY
ncbi:MAG: TraB/GumN family protein [Sphingopyxis sp.]